MRILEKHNLLQVRILNSSKEKHHQAIQINQKWHLPVWLSFKWKVASHSLLALSPLGQNRGWGQFRTLASQGLTLPQSTILFILFALRLSCFTSCHLKLEDLFISACPFQAWWRLFSFIETQLWRRKNSSSAQRAPFTVHLHLDSVAEMRKQDLDHPLFKGYCYATLHEVLLPKRKWQNIRWGPWYLSFNPLLVTEQPQNKKTTNRQLIVSYLMVNHALMEICASHLFFWG